MTAPGQNGELTTIFPSSKANLMPVDQSSVRATAAALLIGDCGQFLFQLRDNIPHILYPGMLGLFGGHIEKDEAPIDAVVREVHEETGHLASQEDFHPLLNCALPLPSGEPINESVFLLRNVPTTKLIVTEGTLFPASAEDIPNLLHRMTPGTACSTRVYMSCGL